MAGVNKAIILGRLGQDPEMTYTQGGLAVCKFSLATSRKMKDGAEITQWHRCTAFGRAGEIISQYMSKGRQLYIDGEIRYSQYEKDGITRYSTDIIVNEFNFVGSGGGQQQGSWQGGNQQQQGNWQGGNQQQGSGGYQNNSQPSHNEDNNPPPPDNFTGSTPGGQTPPPDDDIPF